MLPNIFEDGNMHDRLQMVRLINDKYSVNPRMFWPSTLSVKPNGILCDSSDSDLDDLSFEQIKSPPSPIEKDDVT